MRLISALSVGLACLIAARALSTGAIAPAGPVINTGDVIHADHAEITSDGRVFLKGPEKPSYDDLLTTIDELNQAVGELEAENEQLREEIVALRGEK